MTLERNMWEHFGCCLLELMCYVDDWFIDLYVIILVEMLSEVREASNLF